jgi:Raf kinase inhibitor-like YbhB/YbcL family protein
MGVLLMLSACGPARPAEKPLSRERLGPPSSSASIAVASPAFADGARIPARHSAYGANLSPPLAWSAVSGAASYALIVEDPDAPTPRPWVHWLIWNLPAGLTRLPEGLPPGAAPAGAAQGRGDAGDVGYFGPKPPSGTHHYHFQLFALDRPLATAPGAKRGELLADMRGHVLASGELVGLYDAPAP